ncbi:MAG: sugar phosphate nucleotidyltransferase [Patescibacteria group bacterium]|nr:sugar phosphate nucleotidyltransferase [Patescibacteria group bacterium]MCL5431531.1 sugar phosphate nucleotidyltransferase [Patescibacteria group bacterium]
MKGVILAGGLGTRLYPLTWATNKHLLPIYDQPMVFYPIQTLVKAGITEIMVVIGGPHAGHFVSVLRNGKALGVRHLEFAFQDSIVINGQKTEGGIPHALALAEDFADKKPVTVILGDNTTDADISVDVKGFKSGARIFLKKVPDPERYGVPVFAKTDPQKITQFIEKPEHPLTKYAVTGLYIFDDKVFDIIRGLKPSERGEYEITDVCNAYLAKDKLSWSELKGYWSDAGTFRSLFMASKYWAEKNCP